MRERERTEAMKHYLSTVLFGAALLLAGGCIFWQNTVRETEEYEPVSGERGAEAPLPIAYGIFRNISGSGRRFMVRSNDGRIGHDEYIRWLDSPEFLMERAFCRWMPAGALPADPAAVWRLGCGLTRFDFERGAAVVAADFELRHEGGNRVVHVEYRVPVDGDSPAAMTAAMTAAMRKCVEELRGVLAAEAKKAKGKR